MIPRRCKCYYLCNMKKSLAAVCLSLALIVTPGLAFSQDSDGATIIPYSMGDQTFSVHAGLFLPLFFHFLSGEPVETGFTHLSLGGVGGLEWGAYLDNGARLGVELGGAFAFSKLNRPLVLVPVTGVFTYEFRFFPFEVGLHAAAGINLIRLDEDLYIGAIVKPRVSAHWNYNPEWAFGLRVDYWWVPELYFGGGTLADQGGFGNFLTVTFSTLHHF